jgi:NADPH:quinone reductase-like Zn-dependent oxidoreductase
VIDQTRPTATFTDITTVRGKDLHYHFTSLFDAPDFRSILERLARLFADGTIEIEVDRRYDLEGVPEGHRAVVEDSFCGKRVVVPEVDETS